MQEVLLINKEVQNNFINGKDSAWTPVRRGVDEDEGSPLQDGVKDARRSKIERSAEAFRVAPPPVHLSLQRESLFTNLCG